MAMADGYGLFWNSDSGDRKYDAQSFEKWLKKFFTSGVFEGDLQVLASSGMTVQVQTGYSNVNGKVGLFESATNVTLSAANSRYPRIDTIIIERNDVNRVIQIDKVTGAYTGENPQPTAPIWDETQGIYQLVLAQIYVGAGVSSISQEDITDKRTDTDVCGYIAGTVNEMDFSQFTAQFEAYFSTFEATQLAEFETWFDHMKDQLDSDAAGHLQAEIDATNGNIGTLASLTTDNKTSAVAAINEVDAHADNAQATANTASSKADIVQAQVANSGDIYSASKAYSVGDLCIYNNVLYRCITACSAGSWATNQSCFSADTLANVANMLSNYVNTKITDVFHSSNWQSYYEFYMPDNVYGFYLISSNYDNNSEMLLLQQYADNTLMIARVSGSYLNVTRSGANVGRISTTQVSGLIRGVSVIKLI